jgi:hypothetical protein
MAIKIQLRRGTEAEFDSSNPTLVDGEVAIVQPDGTTGGYIVIGPGAFNTLKGDPDGRFYYMSGYSKTQMGGVQGTGDTPLTVTAASGQSVPIFVVEDNSGNDILSVSDNESGSTAGIVTIENRGETADHVLVVQGKSGQDQDASGGDLLQVKPDSGDAGKGLTVDHAGNVAIVPMDDSDATDSALKVTASNDSDNPIFRVQQADGTDLCKIALSQNSLIKQLLLGNSPNHADPSNFGVLRSGTTPDNTDSSAASDHLSTPHFRLKSTGSGTAMRGELELNSNDTAGASQKAIAVTKSGTSGNLAEIDYAGNITTEAKGTFADAEIDVTGRTLNDASILRRDEISTVSLAFKLYEYNEQTASPFEIRKMTTTNGDPVSSMFASDIQSTAVVTSNSGKNDSNPDMLDNPGATVFPAIKLVSGESALYRVRGVSRSIANTQARSAIFSYTSDDLITGKTTIRDEQGQNGTPSTVQFDHLVINNSGSDRFLAVAGLQNNTSFAARNHVQVFLSKGVPVSLGLPSGSSTAAFEVTVIT